MSQGWPSHPSHALGAYGFSICCVSSAAGERGKSHKAAHTMSCEFHGAVSTSSLISDALFAGAAQDERGRVSQAAEIPPTGFIRERWPVFALLALLGFQFAPRIPDLKNRRLYSFAKPSAYPALEPLIAGRINVALIRAHWPEILRIAASIQTGTVTASLIMRQLAAYPRQNSIAAALRELGRLERTLFTLDWIEDPELRRDTGRELNKGESRNSLARAVFFRRLGEIRDRTFENQQHRASGLNPLVTAIILWNTRYLNRAIAALREVEDVPDYLLPHLSPLGWEHINLTGDYVWSAAGEMTENGDGFRPLRPASDPALMVA
jgi:hypothetical protein